LRIAVRAMVLGISLGMACFILTTLLKYQLLMLLTSSLGSETVLGVVALVLEPLGSYFVAPVVAYGAGLVLTGPRWLIVATQNVFALVTSGAVMAVQVGMDVYASPSEIALQAGSLAVGIALSGWAMKRGQTTAEGREQAVAPPPPVALAAIDFSKVKAESTGPAAAAPEAAAPAGSPAAPESAPVASTPVASAPAASAPDKPQGS
jgi:hypothetical protein